jgi:hypothetical protein
MSVSSRFRTPHTTHIKLLHSHILATGWCHSAACCCCTSELDKTPIYATDGVVVVLLVLVASTLLVVVVVVVVVDENLLRVLSLFFSTSCAHTHESVFPLCSHCMLEASFCYHLGCTQPAQFFFSFRPF